MNVTRKSKGVELEPFLKISLFIWFDPNVNPFMFSYFEPNFIEKFFWESGFHILAKIEMTRN